MKPTTIAMIGAGGIAQAYAEIIGRDPNLIPLGVFDTNDAAAESWAAKAGTTAYGELDGLLASQPEVVVLATPPVTHPDLAAKALRSGANVLCEKPLAVDRHSVLGMSAIAADAERLLAMPAKFRFCEGVQAAIEMVAVGKIGELRLIENAFTSRVDMSARWNSNPSLSGGGVIIDNGTHSVDLIAALAGPITNVLAVESARPKGMRVEDTARLFLTLANGADATVDLSWSIDKSLADFLRIYGTDGEIRVGWRDSAWRMYGEEWQMLGAGYDKFTAMGGALRQFCESIDGSQRPVTGVREALAAALVIDTAHESLARRGWVGVAELT